MDKKKKRTGFARVDYIVYMVTKYISYISVGLMIFMAFLATADILTSKLFGWTIPNQMDIITYLLIPVVFFSIANVQLDRGLTRVDFLSGRFKGVMAKISSILTNLLGAIVFGFMFFRSFQLIEKYYVYKEMSSSTSSTAFALWPITVCYALGCLLLTLAFLWSILRIFLLPEAANGTPYGREIESAE